MPTMASRFRDAMVGIFVYQQKCMTRFESLPMPRPRYQLSPITSTQQSPACGDWVQPQPLGNRTMYVGKCLRRGGLCVVH
jgi:hypothetical protein